jgi:hypothetical protein
MENNQDGSTKKYIQKHNANRKDGGIENVVDPKKSLRMAKSWQR